MITISHHYTSNTRMNWKVQRTRFHQFYYYDSLNRLKCSGKHSRPIMMRIPHPMHCLLSSKWIIIAAIPIPIPIPIVSIWIIVANIEFSYPYNDIEPHPYNIHEHVKFSAFLFRIWTCDGLVFLTPLFVSWECRHRLVYWMGLALHQPSPFNYVKHKHIM